MDWFRNKKDTKQPQEPAAPVISQPDIQTEDVSSRSQCLAQLNKLFAPVPSKGMAVKIYLENFKSLNQAFGYEYCEKLLSQITAYLKDISEVTVYRYIGVEFILILDGCTEGQASALADTVLERFENVWKVDNVDCLCSAQIGLCSYPEHSENTQMLLKHLDIAVQAAAEQGANQSAVYDSVLHEKAIRRQAIARYLQTALEKNELEVCYRPTYNLKEKRFTRADSYMRIFIQGIGLVGAAEFIPIAEDSGQIRAVGYYALEHAGQFIHELIQAKKDFESICIPVSPILLVQEDFLDQVNNILDRYEIPEGKLALELDDEALSSVYINVNVIMQELSSMGVELVLNHFGSGCAPVTSVLDLPVNTVKPERMFVWQLENNPASACIAGGLIQIARDLDLRIIAEGVETENQIKALNHYACTYQQGFYYAPTMEKDVLMKVLGSTLEESRVTIEEEKLKMKR